MLKLFFTWQLMLLKMNKLSQKVLDELQMYAKMIDNSLAMPCNTAFSVHFLQTRMNKCLFKGGGEKDLPKRSTHAKEAIQCDSQQTQNRDEGQRDDHAAEKQTAVDRSTGSTVHCHGRRYGHAANQKVGYSQGDDQAQGGLLEGLRGPKRQNDKHVAEAAQDSSEHLQGRVDHFTDVHSFTSTFFPRP